MSLYTPASKSKRRIGAGSGTVGTSNGATSNGGNRGQPSSNDISEEQKHEIRDGAIDYHELKVAMRALGFDLKKAEVLKLLRENDRKGEGVMEWEDFGRISELWNQRRILIENDAREAGRQGKVENWKEDGLSHCQSVDST